MPFNIQHNNTRLKRKNSFLIVFLFSVALLVAGLYWFDKSNKQLAVDLKNQTELTDYENNFQDLFMLIQTFESGLRGYAISENTDFISNYSENLRRMQPYLDKIRTLESKNIFLLDSLNIATFDKLIERKLAFNEKIKTLISQDREQEARSLISTKEGLVLSNSILKIQEIKNEKIRSYLKTTNEQFNTSNNRNNFFATLGIVLAILLIVVSFFYLQKEMIRTRELSVQIFEQKEFLKTTLNSIGEGLITTDRNGFIKFINPEAEKLTGWNMDEAMEQPLEKIFNVRNEATGEVFENVVSRILKKGKQVELENNTILYTKEMKELIISNNGAPIIDNHGDMKGAVLFFKDLTTKKILESKLIQSSENLKSIFDNTSHGIILLKNDYSVLEINEKMIDFTRKFWHNELKKGENLMDKIPFFKKNSFQYHFEKALVGEKLSYESEYPMPDGKSKYFSVSLTPFYDEKGVIQGGCYMIENITEQKKYQNDILEKNIQLKELSAHLQNIREEERTHMSREIHDELGQQMTMMKINATWIREKLQGVGNEALKQRTDELLQMANSAITTVRKIAYELRPSILDDMGLGVAIEWQLKDFNKRSGIITHFDLPENEPALSDDVKTGLFRITQESITNVGRYANAKNVWVKLEMDDEQIILSIKDDGIGFDKDSLSSRKTLGILGMKERTHKMNGCYALNSKVGNGTEVLVSIPID